MQDVWVLYSFHTVNSSRVLRLGLYLDVGYDNSLPGLKQIQIEPTHKRKTIDIVATTMWRQYKQAIVVDPVVVDKPGFRKPSNHKCILLYPIDDETQIRTVQYVLKRVLPMLKSGL